MALIASKNNKNFINISLHFVFFLSSIVSLAQSDVVYTIEDGLKNVKYIWMEDVEVTNCLELNDFQPQNDSHIWLQRIDTIDDKFILKGSGKVKKKVALQQCVFWKQNLTIEIFQEKDWLKWRYYYPVSGTIDYSPKRRKHKNAMVFNYELELSYVYEGNLKRQARVCFEYKPNKYAYSKPFEVSISQEQWDWILNYNKTSRNETD